MPASHDLLLKTSFNSSKNIIRIFFILSLFKCKFENYPLQQDEQNIRISLNPGVLVLS